MTRSRDALVADFPGLTRDRKYGEGSYEGQRFIVIDTGGLTGDEQGLDLEMARQSMQAVEEADIVLFLVDGRAGLTAGDELIADSLRRSGKQAHLVVNKTDGQDPDIAASDFYSLGFESTFLIAASHNRGIRSMLEILLPSEEEREEEDRADRYPGIRIGVVGRPNVGKSTLVNLIPRFYDVNSGSLAIDGTDIRDVTFKSLRNQIGVVTQKTILLHVPARINLH